VNRIGRVAIVSLVLVLCLEVLSHGQVASTGLPGIPPFGSPSGGPFDTINLANLNVGFSIPLVKKSGRAGMDFDYSLAYNSGTIFRKNTVGSSTYWTVGETSSWGWKKNYGPPTVLYDKMASSCYVMNEEGFPVRYSYWYHSNYRFVVSMIFTNKFIGLF
jgi:hypothetical protein